MVDTLDGKIKLKVKPETQNGAKARLKEKGFPIYKQDGKFGDLFHYISYLNTTKFKSEADRTFH